MSATPFPSLTKDGWSNSKPSERARRFLETAIQMRHKPDLEGYVATMVPFGGRRNLMK
jgi:hypothetical protein